MRKSALLDRGREHLILFPQITHENRNGSFIEMPDMDHPVHVRVNASTDRQSDAELNGQVSNAVLKVSVRSLPVSSWARVHFRGEAWDLATPAATSQVSKATRHNSLILRSRNEKVVMLPWPD